MSDSPLRLPSLNRWREGDEPSANHFNEGLDAIEDLKRGIDPASPSDNAPRFTALPMAAKWLITDATLGLASLFVGGVTYAAGDYVFRATATNSDRLDGMYMAIPNALWPLVAKLSYDPSNTLQRCPIYPHGTLISIWGSGTPRIFQCTFSGALTF